MRIKNYEKIAEHGGFVDNAEFIMMKCSNCGSLALYDAESSFIYLNPKDLTQKCLYGLNIGEPVFCPSCKKENSLEEASDNDLEDVMNSEWAFLIV